MNTLLVGITLPTVVFFGGNHAENMEKIYGDYFITVDFSDIDNNNAYDFAFLSKTIKNGTESYLTNHAIGDEH
jgi:hypothetical protein